MLIRKISVSNFRKLVGPVVVDGLCDGVNIIAGDNEEGKSTLLQAIKSLILARHNSKAAEIKSFKPYNGAARPELHLDFEFDGKKYSIHKAFLSNPIAELRAPDGLSVGPEAEEKIREIFGLGGAVKAGKKAGDSDPGILGLLWLEQGSAHSGLQADENGKEVILQALENDIAAVVGGQRGRRLQKEIAEQYDEYYGAEGKERIKIKGERAKVENLKEELQTHKNAYEAYRKKLDELLNAQEALSDYEKRNVVKNLENQVKTCAEKLAKIALLKPALEAAVQLADNKRNLFTQAKAKLERRQNLQAEKARLTEDSAECHRKIEEASVKYTAAKELVDSLTHAFNALSLQVNELSALHAQLLKKKTWESACHELAAVERSLAHLAELKNKHAQLTEELAAYPVDKSCLADLEQLNNELIAADVRANAAATKIRLQPASGGEVLLNGEAISGQEILVRGRSVLTLGGWGELEIVPGGSESSDLEAEYKNASAKLNSALSALCINSLEQARETYEQRRVVEANLTACRTDFERAGADKSGAQLKLKIEELEATIEKLGGAAEFESLTASVEEVGSNLLEAKKVLDSKASELALAKNGVTSLEMQKIALDKDAGHLRLELARCDEEMSSLSGLDEASQEKAIAEAKAALEEAERAAETRRSELSELDEIAIKDEQEKYDAEFKRVQRDIKVLNETKLTLSTEIKITGQSGLGEKIQQCEGEWELAAADFKRLETQALALKLLHETLNEAEKEGKAELTQPVIDRVGPKLQMIIPGAKLVLDESRLEIATLTRDGIEEEYHQLSVGTREQISVLTRLGMGLLLRAKGLPAALVLDDALVYSDSKRFGKMKEILSEAASEIQIVILTCRKHDYLDMSGTKIFELGA